MIKVFYAPAACRDATEYLFEEALKICPNAPIPDFSRILYLAPYPAKVREAQRIFHRLVNQKSIMKQCYIPPEIMTPGQLSKCAYSIYGEKRQLKNSLIPVIISMLSGRGIGFSSLVADLIRDIKRSYPGKSVDEVRVVFGEVFQELNLPESMVKLIHECLDLFGGYGALMDANDLVDEDDIRQELSEYLPKTNKEIVIIDGFFDPDASERELIKEVIKYSKSAFIAVPCIDKSYAIINSYITFIKQYFNIKIIERIGEKLIQTHKVSLHCHCERPKGARQSQGASASVMPRHDTLHKASILESKRSCLEYNAYSDPESEVEGIARNIKSLYVSGKLKELEEIVVTFPVLDKYGPMVERVFRRYGIPFWISRRRPLGRQRPFLDLLNLLRSVAEDYPRLPFAQFLSSGYFGRIPESLKSSIPSLSLQSGIISGKGSWLNLLSEGSETLDVRAVDWNDIRKHLNWVFKKLAPLEACRTETAIDSIIEALGKTLNDFGFLETISLVSKEGEEVKAVREEKKAFQEIIENISFLGRLYPHKISLTSFIDIMRHFLNASFLDEEGRGVRVMDFSEIAELSPEYLYFGGLSDEAMPGRQRIDYFLPDSAKRKMGFLHLDKHIQNRRFIFERILNSTGHLSLSYPMADGENRYLPSSFLFPGEESNERIPGIFSVEEYLVAKRGLILSPHISEIKTDPAGLSSHRILRVTDIDAYRFCPRRFFIEKAAGLVPPAIKEYEVEAITLGNIFHKIMERIIPGPIGDIETMKKKAVKIAEEVINEKKIAPYWKELIKDTFLSMLPDIYEKEIEMREDGYSSSVVEKTITGEPLIGIKLKGKIDRFDKINGSVRIIDYKTGSAGLTCAQVEKGNENLQLFLYAAIMKNQGYSVDRVGIYSLKDIQVKWCPPKGSRRCIKSKEQNILDNYIAASLRFLEEAVKGMRAGDFTARPLNEYNCRSCHEFSLCPYIQQ